MPVAIITLALLVTLHSSLQHEIIHGHPTSNRHINNLLAFPALGMVVPFGRYRVQHLQHHRNWLLTDPHEDSESYFIARTRWLNFPKIVKVILTVNNTLIGRLSIGPLLMIVRMLSSEWSEIMKGNQGILRCWLVHLASVTLVLSWLIIVEFPVMIYLCFVAYPALSLLSLRSFTEHLPEFDIDERSAIVKSNRLIGLLFLNNNLHRVHHDHPRVAWYQLPRLYQENYQHQQKHVFNGYLGIIRRYAFRPHFKVDHPFLHRE